MKLRPTHGWILWCLLAALGAPSAAQRTAPNLAPGALRHTHLWGVASAKSLDNVNRNDARASLKIWFDVLAQQRGFVLDSRVDIVDTVAEIRDRLQSHTVDVLVLTAPDYLELESHHLVVPALAHVRGWQGNKLYSYVMLVNPASAADTTVAGLRGKTLLAASHNGSNAALAWADVLLSTEKLGRAASFFASVKVPATAQACILPVFFGSADVCAVDEINLELAKEMNPQLGRLRVIARSRPMLESLIATPVEPHPYRKELFDAMMTLHQDPRGRQMLMVFKTDRLVPIQSGELDSTRELWRDYERLPGNLPSRGAGVAAMDLIREEH
jgi:ABC-type phosphate/phosphonate transport system substrate-binding protein